MNLFTYPLNQSRRITEQPIEAEQSKKKKKTEEKKFVKVTMK